MHQVEHTHPGFTYDLVMRMIHKADLSVNMNEAILRLQGSVSDQDSLEYRFSIQKEIRQDYIKVIEGIRTLMMGSFYM